MFRKKIKNFTEKIQNTDKKIRLISEWVNSGLTSHQQRGHMETSI